MLINEVAELPIGMCMEMCHLKHTTRTKTEAQKKDALHV